MNKSNYGVAVSGHGSKFILDTVDDAHPPNPKRYTFSDAVRAAKQWESYADTIGGRARVIHLPTNEPVWK